MNRFRGSVLAGKIRPKPGGWFIMKIAFLDEDSEVYTTERIQTKPNIIHCRKSDTNVDVVDVFRVEGLKRKKDILNNLQNPVETLRIRDFRRTYGERDGDIWGPYEKSECVRNFMNFDKLVKTTSESMVNGVSLAKEVQAIPLVEATIQRNAINIQRLATAVVETTELKEEPPEKEIAEVDKILICNRCSGDYSGYSGRKGLLHVYYITMASVIAAAGLWTNSGPTVVASMLVSSMMEPIKGIASIFKGVKSSRSNGMRFLFHFLTLLGDMVICIVVGLIAGVWARQPSADTFVLDGKEYSYTGLEFMSGNNVMGEGRKVVDGKVTMFLPGEMSGRTKWQGLLGAIVVAGVSAAALVTADKKDNKAALVGIGISASLLPPMVNAGMLWSFTLSDRIPVDSDFASLGAISFALTWINVAMIILVWGVGYAVRERCCTRSKVYNPAKREIEMTNNPMRERTPLLF